jgi:uncharacterized protein
MSQKQEKTSLVESFANCCGGSFARKVIITLVGILLAYLIVLVGTMIRNNMLAYDYIGQEDRRERTITVSAEGKVTATPDIAMTTMGMVATGKTVASAQAENTKVMNRLINELKNIGVASEDIQTQNYNIYPQYNYNQDEGRRLTGYQVSQNVSIKIRDLDKANQVLALAGDVGANSVSGLSFTIDDREVYKQQARELALKKAGEKAKALSKSLGVRFVGIVSYNEADGGQGIYPYESRAAFATLDAGGAVAPEVEPGSTDVMVNVSVTFEIR